MSHAPHDHCHGHESLEMQLEGPWSTWELGGFLAGCERLPAEALDIGCGTGGDAVYLAALGIRTTGLDMSTEALDVARRRASTRGVAVTWINGSATDIPLADGSMDFATDRGCLHHIPAAEHPRYAQEVARVLRPGGTLLVRDMSRDGQHSHQITIDAIRAMIVDAPMSLVIVIPFRSGEVHGELTVLRRD